MAIQQHKIAVQKDHLRTLSRSRPTPAMAELIWNSLDADASSVQIYTAHGETGLSDIVVRDNGHGISHKEARDLFTKLGGSWKAKAPTSREKGRILHGKEGKGRFRALALGRVAEWKSFFKESGKIYEFTIEMFADQLDSVRISDAKDSISNTTGVTLTISEPEQQWQVFENGDADRELEELFL